MKKPQSQTVNQTFSLPIAVSHDLHAYVKRREMSRFVASAICKELEATKNNLREAYKQANSDEGQKEAGDWEDTLADATDSW